MASQTTVDSRTLRLTQLFSNIIYAKRTLGHSRDAKLFIESIPLQGEASTAAHKLVSSPSGLHALQASMRFDTSLPFINTTAVNLLRYFECPALASISSGAVLHQLLSAIVDPPFFWDAFSKEFLAGSLTSDAERRFAWLLLQLILMPSKSRSEYLSLAGSPETMNRLLNSPNGETRNLGQKIKHCIPVEPHESYDQCIGKPGGRHNNDHQNYRDISIMPTADELLSKDRPFLRTTTYIDNEETKSLDMLQQVHVDNQFRLLREDMLGEVRQEMKVLMSSNNSQHRGAIVSGLELNSIEIGTERKRVPWGIKFSCTEDIPQLKKLSDPGRRSEFLKNNNHVLRHGNIACLLIDKEPVAFPTIHRDIQEMSRKPPVLTLQFVDDDTLSQCLFKSKTSRDIRVAQLDSAVFAFEPFLSRLQQMNRIPLAEELFCRTEDSIEMLSPSFQPTEVINDLEKRSGKDIKAIVEVKKSIVLDDAQMRSLIMCLRQRVSLVQGPPGTGKSFIGALVAKILYHSSEQNILVVCFTNHALDQFLEDLLDIGIPQQDMIRLGSKSSPRTKQLMIREQQQARLNATQWTQIDKIKQRLEAHEERLKASFLAYRNATISKAQIMVLLEFLDDDLPFFDAFTVPSSQDGLQLVGKKNRRVDNFYLLDRWLRDNQDSGLFKSQQSRDEKITRIWQMTPGEREISLNRWKREILSCLVEGIRQTGQDFNELQAKLSKLFAERDCEIIKSKRIIGCTTNGAATYSAAIQSASPGVVLVEEAGEILEAHILTSMSPHTEQLIMIGDHQQLRPKCSYELGVEIGEGFDLNRSLFERMILGGYPHVTLTKQHRMRSEISATIKELTYPDLVDAPSTLNRPNIRGFQDNLIFVNHTHPEVELKGAIESRDGRTASKQNEFESQMILKCVRYLAQQGYGSDKIVVLTPYLGQLKLLRAHLAKDNDPILNDLDTFDLVRAGLLTDLDTKTTKPSLRISTIDNYQGEESDIVLVSLTRSNKRNDIGFMGQPERLNVMLSRARNALIMIGNSQTFMNSRKGKEVWRKLFDHLKLHDHVYDGLPVRCERHPSRVATLSAPTDFEIMCPDGGCQEPCGTLLKCGVHQCASSCHQLSDHSKILCKFVLSRKCPNDHDEKWHCYAGPPALCQKCEKAKKENLKKAQRALEEQRKRDENSRKHQIELAKLEEEIEKLNQDRKVKRILDEQRAVLEQRRQDLENARISLDRSSPIRVRGTPDHISSSDESSSDTIDNTLTLPPKIKSKLPSSPKQTAKSKSNSNQQPADNSTESLRRHIKSAILHNASKSSTEWQRQKDQENAHNPAIDQIMAMIGLEDVKEKVLKIKAKVETAIRQGTDLKKERLGLVLLGNPGTGKTTVARHYANVLTSLNVLSGSEFIETTGARLAHGGVKEAKDHIEKLLKAEGGVYFIDEAYQLAEGHNYGGKQVLDFLLAEIENLMGKVVFVFAGYTKQMEKFFEHNPGFASRIPHRLVFDDYKDPELLLMLQHKMAQVFQSDVKMEAGPDGIYMNIAIRRLGRGRGRDGFGNARDLENVFQNIRDRQAARLQDERFRGLKPDDFYFTKEDLIGPDPSKAIKTCDAWTKLQNMIGLKAVKESVQTMIDLISTNYQRELQNRKLVTTSLNRVFLGSPGTGKTTVAKLFGQILAHIGVLSNGEVVLKNPADFIGSVIGESEKKTKAILANSLGKVLIIDEAYMLHSAKTSGNSTDIFRTAVIDTIVAEVQNVPGDDQCVLLCGYERQMEEMFQHVNPGLARRFQLKEAFRFADFSDDELEQILQLKLKSGDLGATPDAVRTAIDVLSRARNGLNFGNGGDVENLISTAKINFQARQSLLPSSDRSIEFCFEPQDFDPAFDRSSSAETNLHELFKDVIGCEDIIEKLRQTLKFAQRLKADRKDPRDLIPMNFVFRGPPGTGKTTTARKFGQVFYDLGFLSAVEVVECSATDFIGQYIGQTAPKTLAQMERGLGKVLFIDEAYRLAAGHFAQEAMDEIVGLMTQDQFKGKMIVILAGYDKDMDRLLDVNQGLRSRFPEDVYFHPLNPAQCLEVLWSKLTRNDILVPILDTSDNNVKSMLDRFKQLSSLSSWGNARDIETLTKRMVADVYTTVNTSDPLSISSATMLLHINDMLNRLSSNSKANSTNSSQSKTQTSHPLAQPDFLMPPTLDNNIDAIGDDSTEIETPETLSEDEIDSEDSTVQADHRDQGVSDAVWRQLQDDLVKANEREHALDDLESKHNELKNTISSIDKLEQERHKQQMEQDTQLKAVARLQQRWEQDEAEAIKAAIERAIAARDAEARQEAEIAEKKHQERFAARKAEEEAKARELMRLRELERLKAARQRFEAEKERKRIEMQMEQIREIRRKEEAAQVKLRQMGVCVAGYRWIHQAHGYRCAGGSHFISHAELGI